MDAGTSRSSSVSGNAVSNVISKVMTELSSFSSVSGVVAMFRGDADGIIIAVVALLVIDVAIATHR